MGVGPKSPGLAGKVWERDGCGRGEWGWGSIGPRGWRRNGDLGGSGERVTQDLREKDLGNNELLVKQWPVRA